MTTVRWCAESTWSSGISVRTRRTRAASSPKRRRSTCRISRWPIRRTKSRRALVSRSQVRATIARRCGSPSVRERRSMADKDDKKAKKPGKAGPEAEQAAKPAKGEKGDKAPKAAQAGKGEKGAKAGGERPAGEKVARAAERSVPARLKVEFDQKIRANLTEKFGYKNRMQVPELD